MIPRMSSLSPAGERVGVRGCALIALAVLALPAQAVDVRYGVALRTDVRTRTPLPGDMGGTVIAGDLELAPRAEVSLGIDTSTLSAAYTPSLIWRDLLTGGRLIPLHRGRLAFTTRWQRATFLISEDGAYGVADIGALRTPDEGQPGAVVPVQTIGTIPYVRSATLIGLELRPADRFTLGLSASYSVSGSLERTAAMPLQYGPSAIARARLGITRTDGLTTTAQVNSAHFVTGAEQLIAMLTETWDRQVSRTVIFTLGAGAAFTREVVVDSQRGRPGTYSEVLPVATTSLGWRDVISGHPLRLDTSLRLAPFADRFTGFIYERLEGRVQGEWRPARDWIATAATGAAFAVPIGGSEQAGDRLVFGESTVAWSVKAWLLLQVSGRVLWSEQPRFGIPGLVQGVGTVSVTVHQQDSLAW